MHLKLAKKSCFFRTRFSWILRNSKTKWNKSFFKCQVYNFAIQVKFELSVKSCTKHSSCRHDYRARHLSLWLASSLTRFGSPPSSPSFSRGRRLLYDEVGDSEDREPGDTGSFSEDGSDFTTTGILDPCMRRFAMFPPPNEFPLKKTKKIRLQRIRICLKKNVGITVQSRTFKWNAIKYYSYPWSMLCMAICWANKCWLCCSVKYGVEPTRELLSPGSTGNWS
jgi:hypothetical protein